MIGQLHSKILMLEKPKKEPINGEAEETGQDKTDQTEEKPAKKTDKGIYEL